MAYRKPPLAVFIEAVKRYDKRIGLRMLYREFEVPEEIRPRFRVIWDKIAEEIEYASQVESTETPDGDSGARAGQGKAGEPWCPTDEPEPATRVCSNKRKTAKKSKKKKTKKKKKT